MNPQRCYRYSPEAAITHNQPKARPLALTNAALGVGKFGGDSAEAVKDTISAIRAHLSQG